MKAPFMTAKYHEEMKQKVALVKEKISRSDVLTFDEEIEIAERLAEIRDYSESLRMLQTPAKAVALGWRLY